VTRAGLSQERIAPEDLGLSRAPRETVEASDLEHAAALVRGVVNGQERGPTRDMTLMAAAGALLVSDHVQNLRAGVARAAQAIDDGSAQRVLTRWIELSHGK
jgi:anthranilate phosphoribosyltransferase